MCVIVSPSLFGRTFERKMLKALRYSALGCTLATRRLYELDCELMGHRNYLSQSNTFMLQASKTTGTGFIHSLMCSNRHEISAHKTSKSPWKHPKKKGKVATSLLLNVTARVCKIKWVVAGIHRKQGAGVQNPTIFDKNPAVLKCLMYVSTKGQGQGLFVRG